MEYVLAEIDRPSVPVQVLRMREGGPLAILFTHSL
jgi:hypothetical protein